jgi:hypothetical protein
MLQAVPSLRSAHPRLLATFSYPTFVIVQVTGANTLYLAETENQLMMGEDSTQIDALQVAAAAGILGLWWNGDMWAAGSQVAGQVFKPCIVISGATTGSQPGGGPPRAYGIEPQP